MADVTLEKICNTNQEAFINLYNLFHHDRAAYVPDLYPAVDEAGYYDKANSLATLGVAPDKAQSYIIRYNGNIAGLIVFAFSPLLKAGFDYSIVDLFVLNNFRGKGIAGAACKQLLRAYPGRYYVEVLAEDAGARGYWERFIAEAGRLIKQTKVDELLVAYEFVA